MPNPISRVDPKAGFDVTPDAMLAYPELTALIAQTIAVTAEAELLWPLLAAVMGHAMPKTFVAIFADLTSSQAARAMVGAVARSALNPEDLLLFHAVEKATAPARAVRNAFAHHLWALSPKLKNALVLVDPEAYATFAAGFVGPNAYANGQPPNIDKSKVMVYRIADLRAAVKVGLEYRAIMHELRLVLDENWPIPELRVGRRKQLSTRPAVAQALHTLRQQMLNVSPPPRQKRKHLAS